MIFFNREFSIELFFSVWGGGGAKQEKVRELPSPPFQELIGHLSWHVKSRNEGVRVGHITEFPERGVG